ncbi:MAG: tRNA pseudouridine(38-40) synthase TruA [Bacteroidetes bacterium]|nr:tRNA pseudouridine(38-40) synthase TruA [Bacteroidota bacterium]
MSNYKLTIQYDGTDYAGWQIQENARTVQETISDSIKVIITEEVNLIASGRTDSGVHALGQVVNFRYEKEIDIYRFQHSLNSILPIDISVINIQKVSQSFHARFDAKERTYLYLISKEKYPFYYKYSLLKKNLDISLMNELSNTLLGKKDFTSFCRKNSKVIDKTCNVNFIRWREIKNFYLFFISADRFLHGMVRTIIGTLLRALDLGKSKSYVENIINEKERKAAGEAVPAKGLFLYRVKY